MAGKTKNSLKILQWNCRSLIKNLPYLINHISGGDYAILCLQSPNCYFKNLPKIEGYYYPPVRGDPLDDFRPLTVIYVKIGLAFQQVPSPLREPTGTSASSAICVQLVNRQINICNIYHPSPDFQATWAARFSSPGWLVVGDFNIHSRLWSRHPPLKEDQYARDAILDSELVVLNDGSATRLPDASNHSPSAIDLSLATPDLVSDVEWSVGDDPLASDHLPITIVLLSGAVFEPPVHTVSYRYDKADWQRFRQILESKEVPNVKDLDIEGLDSIIKHNILAAADLTIPVTKPGGTRTRNNPWWTPECAEAVRAKRKACRHYKRNITPATHAEMVRRKAASNKIIAKAKQQHWQNYIQQIDSNTKLSDVYSKIKKMKQQYIQPDPVFKAGDKCISTSAEKAEAFADTFAAASSMHTLPEGVRRLRESRENEGELPDPPTDHTSPLNNIINISELERALSQIKKVKVAEGGDRVSYSMLRELPQSYKDYVLELFRRCWEEGVIPTRWKHAIVTPVLKPGKPRKDLGSYRPISLTSHLGKIFERILKNRLEYYAEKNGLIPRCQAGFRRGRGVTDHIVKLSSHARKAIAKRRLLFALLFDIRRAYDTVWHRRLLEKLQKIGINGNMYSFIKSFLKDRTFAVRWRGAVSTRRALHMGVPQGSVIAPLLFSLVLHDIEKIKNIIQLPCSLTT